MLFIKKYTLIIYEKTHTHTLSWNHIFCWVHEGESWEGLAGGAYRRLLIHGVGDGLERELWVDVADVRGASLKRSDTCRHSAHSWDNQPIGSESFLPCWGWTGVWASGPRGHPSWWVRKRNVPAAPPEDTLKINPAGICCVWYASPLTALLQSHGCPPNAWRRIFPTVPARASGQPGSHRRAAARGCEGCSQTSPPCFGYKMEAVRGGSRTGKGEGAAAAGGDGE